MGEKTHWNFIREWTFFWPTNERTTYSRIAKLMVKLLHWPILLHSVRFTKLSNHFSGDSLQVQEPPKQTWNIHEVKQSDFNSAPPSDVILTLNIIELPIGSLEVLVHSPKTDPYVSKWTTNSSIENFSKGRIAQQPVVRCFCESMWKWVLPLPKQNSRMFTLQLREIIILCRVNY